MIVHVVIANKNATAYTPNSVFQPNVLNTRSPTYGWIVLPRLPIMLMNPSATPA